MKYFDISTALASSHTEQAMISIAIDHMDGAEKGRMLQAFDHWLTAKSPEYKSRMWLELYQTFNNHGVQLSPKA